MANVVQLGQTESVRALHRFILLQNKGLAPKQIREKIGNAQYNLAEGEMISRAGDPKRFDPATGNFVIWP